MNLLRLLPMVFNNTILSCFFFFFLKIKLHVLILVLITQMFIVVAEMAVPTGITTKEAKTEIETYPVTMEAKISECSVWFNILQTFL